MAESLRELRRAATQLAIRQAITATEGLPIGLQRSVISSLITLTGSIPHIKSGRVRALAVASLERSVQLPDVPTVAQTLPGYEVTSFAGVVAPRGTPRPVIDRLNRELRAVLDLPDIRRQFTDLGGDVKASTPEAMMQQVTDEIAKWKRVVDARKIEIQ